MSKDCIRVTLQNLIAANGTKDVDEVYRQLIGAAEKKIGADGFCHILQPQYLEATCKQLDQGIADLLEAGKNRDDLVIKSKQLATDIKLTEAGVFMDAESDGKNQVVTYNGKKVVLANAEMRDSYRRNTTAALRRDQALVEGKLEATNLKCNDLNSVNASIRAKAELQAALLKQIS